LRYEYPRSSFARPPLSVLLLEESDRIRHGRSYACIFFRLRACSASQAASNSNQSQRSNIDRWGGPLERARKAAELPQPVRFISASIANRNRMTQLDIFSQLVVHCQRHYLWACCNRAQQHRYMVIDNYHSRNMVSGHPSRDCPSGLSPQNPLK
jgi:hypothetical protein